MRRIAKKVLLPLLCVMALCVCTFGALSINGTANTASVTSVYDDDGDGVVTAWDIIEHDGYIEGCWYPWFTHSWLGSSLVEMSEMEAIDSWYDMDKNDGTSTKDYWQNMNQCGFDQLGADQIKQEIFNLKALGFNMMAFMGSPWGEGVQYDTTNWKPVGVKADYLKNMRKLLDICREVGMPVLWYVHCHSSAVPGYVSLDMWYRITQIYSYPEEYGRNFVLPVAQVLSEYRDVVVMVGLSDELENEMNDSNYVEDPKFKEGSRHEYGVTQEVALKFQAAIGQTVKSVMPDMPLTVASNKNDYAMSGEAMLDFPGRNQYGTSYESVDKAGGADLNLSGDSDWAWVVGPYLATEWGWGDGSDTNRTEAQWSAGLINKREAFVNKGYSGWFHWAYQPTLSYSAAGGNQYLKQSATSLYDFRQGMYDGYYWTDARKAALKPANHTAGGPSAMYHRGEKVTWTYKSSSTASTDNTYDLNGKVYWIQPKNVTSYKVERSVDGGRTWVQISGSVAIDSTTGSHRYCMTDPSPVTSGTVQYRITANGQTSYTNVWTYKN